MSTTQQPFLKIDELQELVKRAEPAAFLVPARLLRRVIKQHRKLGGIRLVVPHRKGYVIDRDALLRYVQPAELGLAPGTELPAFLFLIVRPDPERLARYPFEQALLKYARILFHLHIDHHLQQRLASGTLTRTMVRQRVQRLGLTEFAEIATVLRQENYLVAPHSLEAIYAEFVAVYLTLRRFDPARVAHFFPGLRDLAGVDAIVGEDVDADAIFNAARLPGMESDHESRRREAEDSERRDPGAASSSSLPASSSLSDRLRIALELSADDAGRWREALRPLQAQSVGGSWSQESRLLYDLDSACVAGEHGIYTVDLVEWALSLGQLPIKRQLPGHQEVAIVRCLRRAMSRTPLIRVSDAERQSLVQLFRQALESRERRMRERFRPLLVSALDDVGLKPAHAVEGIGRAKLIEELLDRVVAYGHVSIGNLRDALSRNQMKLPDLKGPGEWLGGDPLIRLNRKLAVALDGVYRRGEFYMRLLHRLSSLAFGTTVGRLLVLFLILPFGLAFFVMITPGIAVEEGEKLAQMVGLMDKPPQEPGGHGHQFPVPNLWGVAGLGIFFLLLFNVGSFRNRLFSGLGMVGRVLQKVLVDGPIWLVHLPPLQAILHNRFWRIFRRVVFWPTLMAALGGLLARGACGLDLIASVMVAAGCATVGMILLNTRLGRDAEEIATDWLLQFWIWISIDFVPGLLHLIMDVSRWFLDAVEQILYAGNEWLRFRNEASRATIGFKAVLGLLWFWVTYLVRFAVNLLIEPQVNPIKHFPVVTVSHKICLPLIPTLASFLRSLNVRRPTTTATGIIFGIPGIFGFMVWELKENWKLYASNRARNLKPVAIGSHGETMLRLLHPGFHSGTLPKLYQRLRQAERHEQQQTIRKIKAELHHVGESVAHFVERELLALLRQSKGWGGLAIDLAPIRLATNRMLVQLDCPALGQQALVFAFAQQDGWLMAGVLEPGWLPRLNAGQQQTLAAALGGLYKLAGVHLTQEQIRQCLPPPIFAFSIRGNNLIVWTHADDSADAAYDLSAAPMLLPKPQSGCGPTVLPVLDAARLMFSSTPLPWDAWQQTWDDDHASGTRLISPAGILPDAKE